MTNCFQLLNLMKRRDFCFLLLQVLLKFKRFNRYKIPKYFYIGPVSYEFDCLTSHCPLLFSHKFSLLFVVLFGRLLFGRRCEDPRSSHVHPENIESSNRYLSMQRRAIRKKFQLNNHMNYSFSFNEKNNQPRARGSRSRSKSMRAPGIPM